MTTMGHEVIELWFWMQALQITNCSDIGNILHLIKFLVSWSVGQNKNRNQFKFNEIMLGKELLYGKWSVLLNLILLLFVRTITVLTWLIALPGSFGIHANFFMSVLPNLSSQESYLLTIIIHSRTLHRYIGSLQIGSLRISLVLMAVGER